MIESRYTKWIALIAVWTAVGLILSTEVYFTVRVTRPEIQFWDVLASQYARVSLWALLTPVILWLRRVLPLSTWRWVGGVGFHLTLSLAVMSGYYLARIAFVMIKQGEPMADFWEVAWVNFFGRNLIDVVFYWAIMGAGYTFEIYRKYKNEQIKAAQLESRLVQTELSSLKQQLHPHFLFNTMNTIAVLVREARNEEAVSLLSKLSALLRISLDTSRVEEVTVRQEMEFLERYIDIQKMRFADRLSVSTDISTEALEARIPNLLLQPLVENAILHGVAPKSGPGLVRVLGSVLEGRLHLEVIDNGMGIDNAKTDRSREGIGLTNTRERLNRIYGTHSQLVLKSEPGQGTTVSIVLPRRV
ncbi:sensor histidine kinase [Synoicihabitans lomoniglobus]|uniref:histidine kinase n=1 Tax=Synoicihabitans lomoniglobus TaxID=2909285 RepID=A0AAF0CPJ1_9BACT|nr:histidine kinase [Opitutaceae bacterium LMO-M01]WED65014.1 histidine kinase [Opitutaceae bacterium LMO-M01]